MRHLVRGGQAGATLCERVGGLVVPHALVPRHLDQHGLCRAQAEDHPDQAHYRHPARVGGQRRRRLTRSTISVTFRRRSLRERLHAAQRVRAVREDSEVLAPGVLHERPEESDQLGEIRVWRARRRLEPPVRVERVARVVENRETAAAVRLDRAIDERPEATALAGGSVGPVHCLGPDLQPVRAQPWGAEEQLDEQLEQCREEGARRRRRHPGRKVRGGECTGRLFRQ